MFIVDNRSEADKAQGAKETTTVEVPSEMKKYPAVIPSENQNHKVLQISIFIIMLVYLFFFFLPLSYTSLNLAVDVMSCR